MSALTELVFRILLRLYPAEFRARYGAELVHDYQERARVAAETRGFPAALVYRLRASLAVVPSAIRVHAMRRASGRRTDRASEPSRHASRLNHPSGHWGANMKGDVLRDLRFSARMLMRNPTFSATAILTLALGIGLNAATFSAVNGTLLMPLDGVRDVDELVQVYRRWAGLEYGSNSIPHYQTLRDRTGDVFENVAAYTFEALSVSVDGRSERTMGLMVSANFFQTYGVQPALGRTFAPGVEDGGPGQHPVAVLGHAFWRTWFGEDPSVVGRTMIVNGHPFEIVGVAPESFRGPVNFAVIPVYVPIMMQRQVMPGRDLIEAHGSNFMTVVARLRDGQTLERAAQRLDALLLELRDELPDSYEEQLGTTLVPQSEAGIHPSFRSAQLGLSTVTMVVVALLLLIACVNVANLFLARARERRSEMAIRLSLGAGGRRLVQALLTESVVISVLGGAVGIGVARIALGGFAAFRPPIDGPFEIGIDINARVLVFTAAVSLACGLIFGLAPALQAASPNTLAAVKGGSASRSGRSRVSSTLVVLQMAGSLVLLVSSGLFLRSLQGATAIDPGFDDPGNLVLASLDPGLQGYDEVHARELFDRLADRIRSRPDVTRAAWTNTVPLGLSTSDRGVVIPGYEFAEGERSSLHYAYVTEDYFEAMGIDVVSGRSFTQQDDDSAPPVIMINRRFAERFWPGESALGKVVETAGAARQVIGVVETGKYRSLGEPPTEFMYFPHRERFSFAMTMVVRTPGDPEAVLQAVREAVRRADPDLPLYDVRTMEDHMGIALLPARLGGAVLGMFGLLGLLLAAVGIYGVMAYSVALRTHELGVRVALGATRRAVLGQVLREGMKLTAIGVAIGLAGAAGASRLVQGLLYNVSGLDPVTFVGVPLVLIGVAALAVYVPARRAASVEPMRALNTD